MSAIKLRRILGEIDCAAYAYFDVNLGEASISFSDKKNLEVYDFFVRALKSWLESWADGIVEGNGQIRRIANMDEKSEYVFQQMIREVLDESN